jgi:hypothetical protein
MPRYPNLVNPLANPNARKAKPSEMFDHFQAEYDGSVPHDWNLLGGPFGGMLTQRHHLAINITDETYVNFPVSGGYDFVMECEMVRLTGTPDESFHLFLNDSDNNNKYMAGVGFSGAKLGIGRTVGSSFASLVTLGSVSEVPSGVPFRFRFTRIGPLLTLSMPRAGTMMGGRISIVDTSFTAAMRPGFNSYTNSGTPKDGRMNWIRVVRLR